MDGHVGSWTLPAPSTLCSSSPRLDPLHTSIRFYLRCGESIADAGNKIILTVLFACASSLCGEHASAAIFFLCRRLDAALMRKRQESSQFRAVWSPPDPI